jgi:hypothetical protein
MSGYPRQYGTGMSDLNGFPVDGGFSDFFGQPGDAPRDPNLGTPWVFPSSSIPGSVGSVGGVENTDGSGGAGNPGGPGGGGGTSGSSGSAGTSGTSGSGYPIGLTDSSFFGRSASPLGSDPSRRIINGGFSNDPDYYLIAPKRTRWFNNILQARQKASTPLTNPNAGNPAPGNNGGPNPPINPNPI